MNILISDKYYQFLFLFPELFIRLQAELAGGSEHEEKANSLIKQKGELEDKLRDAAAALAEAEKGTNSVSQVSVEFLDRKTFLMCKFFHH